jgi:hypothetical protein
MKRTFLTTLILILSTWIIGQNGIESKFDGVKSNYIRFGSQPGDTGILKRVGDDLYYFRSERDSVAFGSGTGGGIEEAPNDDTTFYGRTGEAWEDISQENITRFQTVREKLPYWQSAIAIGLFYHYYDTVPSIAVLGDSYVSHYSRPLVAQGCNIYGFAGAYVALDGQNQDLEWQPEMNIYYNFDANWNENRTLYDSLIITNKWSSNTTTPAVIKMTAREFNKIRVHYRQYSGGGDFEVKLGYNGVATAIHTGTPTTQDAKWFSKWYGDVTMTNLKDTVYITVTFGTVYLYGIYIGWHNWVEGNQYIPNGIEVHNLMDGGNNVLDWVFNAGTVNESKAQLTELLDTLGVDLLMIITKDLTSEIKTGADTLVKLLKYCRPEMDIMIINPNDADDHEGIIQKNIWKQIADDNDCAFLDMCNLLPKVDMLHAAHLTTDGIHLNNAGDILTWGVLEPILFNNIYFKNRLITNSLTLTRKSILFPNAQSIYITTSNPPKITGISNYYLGSSIGGKETTANKNIGIGANGFGSLTTGSYIVGVGDAFLPSLTTGNHLVSIGSPAQAVTESTYSVFMGFSAGLANTTGSNNTVVGCYASTSNTTTGSNVAIGFAAARYNTGSENTSLGYEALRGTNGTSTGSYATALGRSALTANTTGAYNTAAGYAAGYKTTSGGYNTYVGNYAGFNNVTGTNQIGIGNYAGAYETASNSIYIDNLDRATIAAQKISSPFYAVTNATVTSQQVTLNGDVMINGALNFGADAGANDTYAVTIAGYAAYVTGSMIIFTANTTNTGACSVNVNTLGAINLKDQHDQDPEDNFIEAGSVVMAVYDGTNFQMIQPDANF